MLELLPILVSRQTNYIEIYPAAQLTDCGGVECPEQHCWLSVRVSPCQYRYITVGSQVSLGL